MGSPEPGDPQGALGRTVSELIHVTLTVTTPAGTDTVEISRSEPTNQIRNMSDQVVAEVGVRVDDLIESARRAMLAIHYGV